MYYIIRKAYNYEVEAYNKKKSTRKRKGFTLVKIGTLDEYDEFPNKNTIYPVFLGWQEKTVYSYEDLIRNGFSKPSLDSFYKMCKCMLGENAEIHLD